MLNCKIVLAGFTYGVVPGRAFKIHKEEKKWDRARLVCQKERGDLVTIDKPEINEWIANDGKPQLWIGASDQVIYKYMTFYVQ